MVLALGPTQQAHDVKKRRIDVDATPSASTRRCFKVMCLLGRLYKEYMSMTRAYYTQTPQINPWHHEEETQNSNDHMAAGIVADRKHSATY